MKIKAKNTIPPFAPEHLEAIAKVLGDLTHPQIKRLLSQCKLKDPSPNNNKWQRLFNAFAEFQNRNQAGNHVIVFIREAMKPALYLDSPDVFRARKDKLNQALSFCGFKVRDDGKVILAPKAATLDEALERANRMKEQLRQRGAHSAVLRFCEAEIIAQNNFHAVLEGMKSITSRIRSMSGFSSDGAELVQSAFAFGKTGSPILKINSLDTETKQGEQKGFVNLLVGLYGMVRNPTAHEAKIEWPMEENDALDILTTISFIHRKLDKVNEVMKQMA